ncbi:F0F1 ATP synthase subunit B' [Yoonia sp. MH D7]
MATETVEHGAETSAGMPQLDFSTFPNQIFWLIVTLVVIYLVLSRVALPRIGSVLAERSGTITNDVAAAEELKQKAVEAEAAYQQALADARAQASTIIAEAKAVAQSDLEKEIKRADAKIFAKAAESEKVIAEIRDGAVKSVTQVAKDTAKELVALFGGTVDAKTITAAVTARMKGSRT